MQYNNHCILPESSIPVYSFPLFTKGYSTQYILYKTATALPPMKINLPNREMWSSLKRDLFKITPPPVAYAARLPLFSRSARNSRSVFSEVSFTLIHDCQGAAFEANWEVSRGTRLVWRMELFVHDHDDDDAEDFSQELTQSPALRFAVDLAVATTDSWSWHFSMYVRNQHQTAN